MKALFLRVLFVTGDALALLINIQDAKPYAAQPIPRAEHMTVYRCLRPVRRNQRVILHAELNLLDNRYPVLAGKQPVRPTGNMQNQRIGFIVRAECLLCLICLFALCALALSGSMGSRTLPHALLRARRRRKVAVMIRRFDDLPNACADNGQAHALFILRRERIKSVNPSRLTLCAAIHVIGGLKDMSTFAVCPDAVP